jgi:hypothetical protein
MKHFMVFNAILQMDKKYFQKFLIILLSTETKISYKEKGTNQPKIYLRMVYDIQYNGKVNHGYIQ